MGSGCLCCFFLLVVPHIIWEPQLLDTFVLPVILISMSTLLEIEMTPERLETKLHTNHDDFIISFIGTRPPLRELFLLDFIISKTLEMWKIQREMSNS